MAIFCTDCICHSSASALPCVESVPPGPALFSSALKANAGNGHRMASPMHRAQGQTGSSAHNHNGRPHPIPIAFPLTGERSRGAYYCGWDKFSWNGKGDGKSSPLTLIWANDTARASYNNTTDTAEKWLLDGRAGPSMTEDSELIKIINCTCHICHLFNLHLMRKNARTRVFLSKKLSRINADTLKGKCSTLETERYSMLTDI